MSERDTHFAGFAEQLWKELQEVDALFDDPIHKTIIAQHAYDLAAHIVQETGLDQYDPTTGYASATVEEVVNRIPDFPHKPDS